jgi:uncharacterized protein (DUF1330 family)
MTLSVVVRTSALVPPSQPEEMARAHVLFDDLTGGNAVERELFAALDGGMPCRAEVVGATGAGKSSVIAKVVADVTGRESDDHEALVLRAADDATVLESPGAFAQHVLHTVRAQDYRFDTAVRERLREVGASELTATGPVVTHEGEVGADAKVVKFGYRNQLQERYEQRSWGQSAANARQELEELVELITAHGVRPLFVIDDTDKFAGGESGEIDEPSLERLFANAVSLLDELSVEFIVAVHPRFTEVATYTTARAKHLGVHVAIPRLPLAKRPLERIFERHLDAHAITLPIDELIAPEAVHMLQMVYVLSGGDLRQTLNAAAQCAASADEARAPRIDVEHVYAALARP